MPISRRLRFPALRFRSLRVQLALWYSSLLALTLLLLVLFTASLLRSVLASRLDANLQTHAEQIAARIAAQVSDIDRLHPGYPIDLETERHFIDSGAQNWGRYVQVINTTGRPVVYSNAFRTASLPDSPVTRQSVVRTGEAAWETLPGLGEYPVRVVTVPVRVGSKTPYLVQVGASVEGVDAALQRTATILLVLTPAVFAIALLGGYTLVGRALKPVDDMTRAALTIESRRLDTRLVPPRTDNEIGRLAGALNTMIARLDTSFRQIERFSADASHELKTPLTAIRGEAEVALLTDDDPEYLKATLRSIIEETERLSSIVNNLLLLARADANQVRLEQVPVNLEAVLLAVYEGVERWAHERRIEIRFDAVQEVTVLGDPLWLQQLIANLVQNAVKYTPEGGTVTLSLRRASSTDAVADGEAAAAMEREEALLTVQDTGPGIAAEHLPRLFDRFYRVDTGRSREQGGSGLGLNIARWVAESHGGRITVESRLGAGTTFALHLPALPSEQ